MYNIAIKNEGSGYTFLTHNNPSINSLKTIAKSLSKFRYELTMIDSALLTSNLVLNIAQLDSKKKPQFYLGIRGNCGENHAPIVVISIKDQCVGMFDEAGKMLVKYPFKQILDIFDGNPDSMNDFTTRTYAKADKPPTDFKFT